MPDAFEPNNQFSDAADIGSGDLRLEGLTIHQAFNDDWYQWKATGNGTLTVDILFQDVIGDLDLMLFDSTRTRITASDTLNDNERVTASVVAGRSYFIQVLGYGGDTNVYDLIIDGPGVGILPDRFEPNDAFAQAADVGTGDQQLSSLTIHQAFNDDWYKWTTSASGALLVDLVFSHNAGNLDLELYDDSGNRLSSSNSTTDNEQIAAQVVAGRMYFVRVLAPGGATNEYQLGFDGPTIGIPPDRFEPNDVFSQAADVGTGDQQLNGLSVHAASNDDWYKWTAPANGTLKVDLLFANAAGNLDLELYDVSGNRVTSSNSITDNEQVSTSVVSGQMYFVRVLGFAGATNNYNLLIDGPDPAGIAADRFEPNDVLSQATDIGTGDQQVSGLTIHQPFNDDWYKWTAAGTGVATFSLAFAHGVGDLDLEFYNSSGLRLALSNSTTDNEQIAANVVAGQMYFIRVMGLGGTNNYSLTIDGPDGGLAADAFEPNDSLAQAADVGTGDRQLGGLTIHQVSNDDWYKWTAPATGTLTTTITFSHAAGNLDLELYGPGQTLLVTSKTTTDNEQASLGVVAGQMYFIRVLPQGGAMNSYSLTIDGPSADVGLGPDRFEPNDFFSQAADLGTGDQQFSSLTIHENFNDDWYKWTSPGDGPASFNVTFAHSQADLDLELFNSRAVRVGLSDSTTDNEQVTLNVAVGEMYFVRVFAAVQALNTYGLQIDGPGAAPPPPPPPVDLEDGLFFSVQNSAVVGGLNVDNEDIVSFDGSSFQIVFDGSDVGLEDMTLDAFDLISANEILMSFTEAGSVTGISETVDDSDIVLFTATKLGATTSGSFSLYFDGSDVELTDSGEDIKGVTLLSDGQLLITTNRTATVSGLQAENSDVLAFEFTSQGADTSGTWSLYFDGSDVGLNSDLDAVSVDKQGNIFLSTSDSFDATTVSGDDEDVFAFVPTSIGATTAGSFNKSLIFDGSDFGLEATDIFGLDISGEPLQPSPPIPGITVTPTSGLQTSENGDKALFRVVLDSQPTSEVRIPVQSTDTSEGTTSVTQLRFTPDNWNVPQTVRVTGIDDAAVDGDIQYTVRLSPAISSDANYSGLDPDDVLLTNRDNDTPPVDPAAGIFFSVKDNAVVGGLSVANEDIVSFTGSSFQMLFDGSDVGLEGFTLDALDLISPSEILMSFTVAGSVPGISGTVDDSDIVLFKATSLGANTTGSFSLYFDGSDVGLTDSGEDIKGVTLLDDGRLLITTNRTANVTGLTGTNADVLAFRFTSQGADTRGTWSLYFDGSDVGLQSDLDAVSVDQASSLYFSTTDSFNVSTVSGNDEDVFVFVPTSVGSTTAGSFNKALFFDGSAFGLEATDIFGFDVSGVPLQPKPGITVTPTSGLETSENGGKATFQVVLDSQPTFDVRIPVQSNDTSEGTVSVTQLRFTPSNWNVPQTVSVTGIDDASVDGDIQYSVRLSPAISSDTNYSGLDPSDVLVTNRDNDTPPVDPGTGIFFSVKDNIKIGSLSVANEDIVSFNGSSFQILFDGSDVGLEGFTLDALDLISPTEILLSLTNAGTIPGISETVDDSDVVLFKATSLGANTAGSFSLYLDGSDVGLTDSGEDIKGVSLLDDGRLLITTNRTATVPGLQAANSDVLAFKFTTRGAQTAGTWSLYLDGSDVGLNSDLDALSLNGLDNIYLSTTESFNVPGVTGDDEDVFVFVPTSVGSNTAGSFVTDLFFDGSKHGLDATDVFGFDVHA